jgi:hypothetical protein
MLAPDARSPRKAIPSPEVRVLGRGPPEPAPSSDPRDASRDARGIRRNASAFPLSAARRSLRPFGARRPRRGRQSERDRDGRVSLGISRLLRVFAARRAGLHERGAFARHPARFRRARAAPRRSERPTEKRSIASTRSLARLSARRLFTTLPEDQRTVARSRTVGADRRRPEGACLRKRQTMDGIAWSQLELR